jgi:hypothetical protein
MFERTDALGLTHGWLMYAMAPLVVANYIAIEFRKNGKVVFEMDLNKYEYKKWFVRMWERRDLLPPTMIFFSKLGKERGIDFDEMLLLRFEKKRPPTPGFFEKFPHKTWSAKPFRHRVLARWKHGKIERFDLVKKTAPAPADKNAAAAKPANAKPVAAKAADAKPAAAQPAAAKPAGAAKPANAKPANAKPANGKPAEAKPAAPKVNGEKADDAPKPKPQPAAADALEVDRGVK